MTTLLDKLGASPSLMIKLGSLARHIEELHGAGGHEADKHAIESLLGDPEVAAFMQAADDLALLPVRRDA